MTKTPEKKPEPQQAVEEEKQIPIDGFKQVLELLRVADPEFRNSLLRRLAQRDRQLAKNLIQDLDI